VVADIADQLSAGKEVTVRAFRTAKTPKDHCVAKSLVYDGNTIQLRDDALRPFWLGGSAVPRAPEEAQSDPGQGQDSRWGPGLGYGFGARRGYGPGYGRGSAWGYGAGYGRGSGWGRGWGYGRGFGRGGGRGAGYGRR
jgi:hypothetical protein